MLWVSKFFVFLFVGFYLLNMGCLDVPGRKLGSMISSCMGNPSSFTVEIFQPVIRSFSGRRNPAGFLHEFRGVSAPNNFSKYKMQPKGFMKLGW